jgi:hypothetical protein
LNEAGYKRLAAIVAAGVLRLCRIVNPDHNIACRNGQRIRVQLGANGDGTLIHLRAAVAMTCKTGGFQETKLNYFNDLQKLRCQLIRLSIRAGTGIEPFKNKGLHGRSELAFW